MITDNTRRFSDRVENYVRYRPTYPKEIIDYFINEGILQNDSVVADVGSGTGILTRLFLENDNVVYAIEPNEPMRQKAEEIFKENKKFVSLNGKAEETTVTSKTIDLIVAGQAFHWFDPISTKIEFKRILKTDGHVALIWNERKVESEFEKSYEMLLVKYSTDYLKVDHRNISEEKIKSFFDPSPIKYISFYNKQIFDWEGLKGRMLSSSYVPNKNSAHFEQMISELKRIFEPYQENGKVKFQYDTKVYIGQLK
jgi:ubiquinone/menaquinone biosynthesis C-methylase UbiE